MNTLFRRALTGAMAGLIVASVAQAHDMRSSQAGAAPPHAGQEAGLGLPRQSVQATPEDLACRLRLDAFSRFGEVVSASCSGGRLAVSTPTGLPPAPATDADRIMVGIEAWIQRVPVPYAYEWRLPLAPQWLARPEAPSPRGPIAVAVDGVPIFHPDRRPDANTDPARYDPRHDTVLAGELDQCGGHSGQGDDYHYHYAPVCLVDPGRLDLPIGFGLDGVPIYFGTGGNAYFGRGRVSAIDNLPQGPLDPCNAVRRSDGTYVHYTTAEPPYVIGCHHAAVDPRARIEPRPLRGRDQRRPSPLGVGQLGEPVRTLVTDYFVDADGWHHLEFDALSGSGTSAVLYRRSATDPRCWEFEHRTDADRPSSRETACRNR